MNEVRSWVTSLLGHNLLLDLFKDSKSKLNHLVKQYDNLKDKVEVSMDMKGFLTPGNRLMCYLKDTDCVKQVESPHNDALKWAKRHIDVHKSRMDTNIPESAQLVLLNHSSFNSQWGKDNGNSLMKIYNSFSYTQDIQYEARILELPLRDKDFKLVILAPNEVDLLHTLFRRLSHDGLRAAICNIQPLFTVRSKLMAPVIKFSSEESYDINLGELGAVTLTQHGYTNVNEQGVSFSVMSYLCIKWYTKDPTKEQGYTTKEQPFFFGLIYQDTPIFTGQFSYK